MGLLRCRPAELYLGAIMVQQRMVLFVYWDGNVYDETVVKTWMEEVQAATIHFLEPSGMINGPKL